MAKKSTTKAKTKTQKKVNVSKITITKRSRLNFLLNVSHEKLNKLSVAIFLLLAGLVLYMVTPVSYEVTLNYLTLDKLNDGAIVPAYRHLLDIELKWYLAFILGLSAVGPLMHATKLKHKYNLAVKSKVLPWRWVEYGVINTLVATLVVLILGYQDLATIKIVAFVMLLLAVINWSVEREILVKKTNALKLHLIEFVFVIGLAIVLGSSLVGTYIYGQVRAPWYVYAVFAAFVATLLLNSMNQYKQIKAHKNWKSYDNVERNYLLINLASKISLAAILIIGFAK